MNQIVKILLSVGIVIAVAVAAIGKYNDTVETFEYRLAKADLRSEFLERSAAVIAIQDPARYEEEIRGLFKWYQGELTRIYNTYPRFKGAEKAYLEDLDARLAAGKLRAEDYEAYKASYEQVREIWDLLQAGRYSPALTAADGSMRIDFLEFEPTTLQGQKALAGRFVLWGAQRRKIEEKSAAGAVTSRYDVQATFRDVQVRLLGKNGKPIGEFTFNLPGGPYVPYPEQKLEDFPPMAFIGTFAFPAFLPDSETMEMESVVVSRSSTGRDITARFAWKQPVPVSWKLAEGETWVNAQVEEREELAR